MDTDRPDYEADPLGLEGLYEEMIQVREPYLRRAREAAALTLPYLLPPDGATGSSPLPTPHQSIGGQGVNNLANLLLDALFPPQMPYFRLGLDEPSIAELAGDAAKKADVEKKLAEVERSAKLETDQVFDRARAVATIKHLIVSGNSLVIVDDPGKTRVHRLDTYVTRRSPDGQLRLAIIKERVLLEDLDGDFAEAAAASMTNTRTSLPTAAGHDDDDKYIDVYTAYNLSDDGGRMETYQATKGLVIPGSEGSWPVEQSPVLALRWGWLDGEDYGRSLIDDMIGDLLTAEGLTKAIREASAVAARVILMVNPNGMTRAEDITKADNLSAISGRIEDANFLTLGKYADLQTAQTVLRDVLQRLSQMFVMHLGVRREAERVTAEETRMVIRALEGSLGGTYALLASELQLPLVRIVLHRLTTSNRYPKLPLDGSGGKPHLVPQITTGVEALGRGEDFGRYQQFVAAAAQLLGPEFLQWLVVPDFLSRLGTSLNIPMAGLVKTQDQIAAEQAQAAQAQQQMMLNATMGKMAEKAAPQLAQAVTGQQ